MEKERIIDTIGVQRYQEACEQAWKAAPNTGYQLQTRTAMFSSDVPSEIEDLIWEGAGLEILPDGGDVECIQRIFEIYEEMPCYSLLWQIYYRYDYLSSQAKALFWTTMRELFRHEEPARWQPAAYTIWCDYLEDPCRVEEAWSVLTQDLSHTRLIEQLLIASGPAPFWLKEALYEHLLKDPSWHDAIFRSLLHSRFDYFGQIDVAKAREVLGHLDLPTPNEALERLRAALEMDAEAPEGCVAKNHRRKQ